MSAFGHREIFILVRTFALSPVSLFPVSFAVPECEFGCGVLLSVDDENANGCHFLETYSYSPFRLNVQTAGNTRKDSSWKYSTSHEENSPGMNRKRIGFTRIVFRLINNNRIKRTNAVFETF
jgi:hypothetical protein